MRSFKILIFTVGSLGGLFSTGMAQGVSSIITSSMYNQMLPHRNMFYTYNAFIKAANAFSGFGMTGDLATRKTELAAFFGEASHETNGGWAGAPDGEYAWGYSFVEEKKKIDPFYYGRGPIQLTHKYNYENAGKAINADLVNNPGLVSSDPVISFKTAIWFWMTAQAPTAADKAANRLPGYGVTINIINGGIETGQWTPPAADKAANRLPGYGVTINIINGGIETGQWTPTAADKAANRLPGYGVTINIINGGIECNKGQDPSVTNRINYYKRYCDMLGVSYGSYLSCAKQKPFNT